MLYEEGLNYKWDIFDVIKVIFYKDYLLIKVGKLILNENFINNFIDIEEVVMLLVNFVFGIELFFDKLL